MKKILTIVACGMVMSCANTKLCSNRPLKYNECDGYLHYDYKTGPLFFGTKSTILRCLPKMPCDCAQPMAGNDIVAFPLECSGSESKNVILKEDQNRHWKRETNF